MRTLENGERDYDVIASDYESIQSLFKSALSPEFPLMSEDQLELCMHRLEKTKPGKYFIDAFLDVIKDRSEMMRSVSNKEYKVDDATLLVSSKEEAKNN